MAKYLHIHLTSPCQEDWENMEGRGDNRFCNSCEKQVIDFSLMNDQQLVDFFKTNRQPVCGRFHEEQLDHGIPVPRKNKFWLKYFLKVSIPALLLGFKCSAQERPGKKYSTYITSLKKIAITTIEVQGQVTNDEGNPVEGASIVVPKTSNGVAADINGLFSIRIKPTDEFIEVSSVGYEKQLVPVNSSNLQIKLKIITVENVLLYPEAAVKRRCIVMGGVSSGVSCRMSLDHETKNDSSLNRVKTNARVFPNPVKKSGTINIQWPSALKTKQQLFIYNAAGIKVSNNSTEAQKGTKLQQVKLNLHAAGYHFLHIIDTETGRREVIPFVAE